MILEDQVLNELYFKMKLIKDNIPDIPFFLNYVIQQTLMYPAHDIPVT